MDLRNKCVCKSACVSILNDLCLVFIYLRQMRRNGADRTRGGWSSASNGSRQVQPDHEHQVVDRARAARTDSAELRIRDLYRNLAFNLALKLELSDFLGERVIVFDVGPIEQGFPTAKRK